MYLIVKFSPSANRMVGPGTVPLYVHALTLFLGAMSRYTSSVTRVICLWDGLAQSEVKVVFSELISLLESDKELVELFSKLFIFSDSWNLGSLDWSYSCANTKLAKTLTT